MEFEELLKKLWGFDAEVFAHDSLFVFINYMTGEEKVFHNCPGNNILEWIESVDPILMGYNCNNYDRHILRCWIGGMTPEELKQVNDHIVSGGNGWDIKVDYIELPKMWDLFNEINPRKSLKEIEGNLRLPITESSVPFDLPTKWTKEQYEDVLYYCRHDVQALFPLFDKLKTDYKSKYIISKLGGIEPTFGLSQTNANLTAILLNASSKNYTDNFKYTYPSVIDKTKIPKEAIAYFDDIIEHNDLNYLPEAPELNLKDILFQIGIGGGHAFTKRGVYYYDRRTSKKLLCNWDFTSLYPNLVRLFGYSSRSQAKKDAYVDLLAMRMKAKKGLLTDDFLAPLGLTNKDLNTGLKLPLNAYTGALRAKFNKLYDNLQGFSICTTGQLIILQLIHDLEKVPTLEMISANTDAVMFEVAPEYKAETDRIIHDLEKLTGLEMEEDNIVRIVMRDVNNYCELLQTGDNEYAINYKGTDFKADSIRKNLKLLWNKETQTWETRFEDAIKVNSLSICGEAMLKYLLLDIPVEETINNCDDIFRFQLINHAGNTYEKVILEYDNGEYIELQKNNRIYSGYEKTGTIYKVKADGRKDSLAMCPVSPVIDNNNEFTIDKLNKIWYINYTKQKINDFKGERKVFMEEKLDKLKKDELIELVKDYKERCESSEHTVVESNILNGASDESRLFNKIQKLREFVRGRNFILDKELPNNLGGGEYVSIEQYYKAIQDGCIAVGLDFSFEIVDVDRFDLAAFKPATGAPQNVATITCIISLTDIDTGNIKCYTEMSQGSDSVDKAVNGASTLAFRNWFDKNFTPIKFNGKVVEFGNDDNNVMLDAINIPSDTKTEIKTPVFVPAGKKEEIKQELVSNPQKSGNEKDIEDLTSVIFKYRELSGNPEAGAKKLEAITTGEYTDADILSWQLSFNKAIEDLGK